MYRQFNVDKKFSATGKIFREINYLVNSLLKLSKAVCCFHEIFVKNPCAHCGICRNLLSHFFGKNFVKTTFLLTKSLSKYLIWRNMFSVRVNFSFFHTRNNWTVLQCLWLSWIQNIENIKWVFSRKKLVHSICACVAPSLSISAFSQSF